MLPWVRAITQTRKGKGNAMACGFAAATGDVIVMFDADGSADPAEIPAFVAALVAGADFAKGSRFAPGGGSDDITLLRRTGNAGLNGVANALFGTSYTDLCYGYNAFWADLLPCSTSPTPPPPHPPTACSGATASKSKPSSTAASPPPACASPKSPPSNANASSGGRTCAPSPTAPACCARSPPSGGGRWQLRARGAGRRAPRFDTVGTPAYARNSHGSESYGPQSYGSDLYDRTGLRAGPVRPGPRGEPALTPAGGIPVTPREPRDAAGEPGAGRAARPVGPPPRAARDPWRAPRRTVIAPAFVTPWRRSRPDRCGPSRDEPSPAVSR